MPAMIRIGIHSLLAVLAVSLFSLPVSAAFPDAPTVPSSSTTGNYTVSWDNASFGLMERYNGGSWSVVQNMGVGASKSFTGKSAGTYEYMTWMYISYPIYTTLYSNVASIVVTGTPVSPR